MEVSVEVTPTKTFTESSVAVNSVKVSVEDFTDYSMEVTSVEASTTKFRASNFLGSFHGSVDASMPRKASWKLPRFHRSFHRFRKSFHEFPLEKQIVQVVHPKPQRVEADIFRTVCATGE